LRLDVCGGMGTHLCLNSWKTGQAADKRWQLKIYDFMRGLELVDLRLVVDWSDWSWTGRGIYWMKNENTACSIILEREESSRKIGLIEQLYSQKIKVNIA
jgi:hypothetical protein